MNPRPTERLICLLESVNAEAVNNDGGRPGEFLAEVCREAAARLRELESAHKERIEQIGEFLSSKGYSNFDVPVADEPVGERMTEEELLRGLDDLLSNDSGNHGC